MLILTRRVGETIIIGEDIVITILGIKGNQVRVGISAPDNISVHREEIYKRIMQEKQGHTAQQVDSQLTKPSSETTIAIKKKRKDNYATKLPHESDHPAEEENGK